MSGAIYEVRVAGLVPADLVLNLGDADISEQETRTVLTARFADEEELHRFMSEIRALDLELVELHVVPDAGDGDEAGR